MACNCNEYLFVNKSRIKFIYTKWTKIDWPNSNDVAAYVSHDKLIAVFLFSVLAGPNGKYFKIKIESVVKNQSSALKKICIEAKLTKDYGRMQEAASDVYNVFLSIKELDFNDSFKMDCNESNSLQIGERKVAVSINGKNFELDFFQDVKLNIEVVDYEALIDDNQTISYPRVKASYSPIGNGTSWTRDRLALKLEAESRNSYFEIDAIEKLINIFTGMIRQNVFEILPHIMNVKYDLCALTIRDILPVSPLTKANLSGVFSYLGPTANVHDLSNLSESTITSQTSLEIRNNTALMCKFLATLRAGLLTLALARGKIIKMYERGDNAIDYIPLQTNLAYLTINIRTQNNNDIVLAGTGQSGATISIFANGEQLVGSAEVDSNGCWEYSVLILRNGLYRVYCKQICLNGHTRKSDAALITINYPVTNPTIKEFDRITNDNIPIITGSGEPGAAISIFANEQKLNGSATVCKDGSWEFLNESFFDNGNYKFQARQDCIRASKNSNTISTQIFVLPDPPSEIKEAFEESEYIDDVVLLKASVRYMLDSFQIVTVGKFLGASIDIAISIGDKNYRNIIEVLKHEANNRLILQNNINC